MSICPVKIDRVMLRDHVTGISRPLVTVGSVRRLLKHNDGLILARRNRPNDGPVSPFVSSLAFQLAGVKP